MFTGLLVFYTVVRTFFFMPFVVQGDSMLPGLPSGDVFLVDLLTYQRQVPSRNDVVVFFLDEDPHYFYVKRIIGLPGDKIRVAKDGVDVTHDGVRERLVEPYLMPNPHPANVVGQDYKVPAGKYFMLGDNRERSADSRFFTDPYVPRENFVGKFGINLGNIQKWLLQNFGSVAHHVVLKDPKNPQQQAIANFEVEIADSDDERKTGLMNRVSMPSDEGMMFIFDDEQPRNFWMKDTLIPLDIIFFDANWRIVSIQKEAQPCKIDPCGIYPSGAIAKYVLEINGGLSDKLHLEVGTTAQSQ